MDIKEPSVHASARSRSQTARSAVSAQQTIESVTMKITIDPVNLLLRKETFPMLFTYVLDMLVMAFQMYIVWHYIGAAGVAQLSCCYPICYFVSQGVPRAIAQGAVSTLTKNIADNKIKDADKTVIYCFVIQFIYLIIALFLAFFLSISFSQVAGLADTDTNYAAGYIPIICTLGTLFGIFNQATIGLLLAENKFVINMIRSVASSLLTLLFQLISYQYSLAQDSKISLTQLAIGQVIGQFFPAAIMAVYYQDFKPVSFQGVIKAKLSLLKFANFGEIGQIALMAAPKISQFGSSSILQLSCNIVVTLTFTEASDIEVARIGLFVYWLFFMLFGFVMQSYIYISQAALGLNLILKKYIRTKDILMQSLIWSIILQGIMLILGFVMASQIVGFFIPASQQQSKDFFLLYGKLYIENAPLLPIILIPYQFCQALYSIENNWKMNLLINLMHPVIGIVTLLTIQFTVGDRADLYYVQFYADLFSGFAALVLLARKLFEVMQLAKIELKRLKKMKKKMEEEGLAPHEDEIDKMD
ncbi:DinF protein [Spironucleus salmonicida]|uniref:DinF protein n=1 Tax=Spironucleus salmonicida TaxID=348837 RepID=V6LPL5_9EUKA|nr:DinF protein [Spironucleus salmonicida]|eukprot:EST46560.1 DinF protein [Spironucleus salmonicida]